MAEKLRARVVRVKSDRHAGALALAAAVSDQTLKVKDAGDFTATGGTLLVDDDAGTLLSYTAVTFVEDTDPSDLTTPDTITLAAPLAVAIPVETALFVYEAPDDTTDDEETQVADVYAVCIPEDDEDAVESGEPVDAVVPPHLQDDLPLGARPGNGVPVVLEWDDDVEEWTVARFRGKGNRGIAFEADDFYVLTPTDITAGFATVPLTRRPIAESIKLWWRTVAQEPTEYTVDLTAQTVTLPLGSFAAAGDRVWVHYAYRRGVAKVTHLLEMVGFTTIGTEVNHGFDATSVPFPAGSAAGDLFVYAATTRSAATNTCTDTRVTPGAEGGGAWVNRAMGLNVVRIWVGVVTSPGTPLVMAVDDLGGVQEANWGLRVIRPDSPVFFDPTKIADSGVQGSGALPGLAGGISGGVGVCFTSSSPAVAGAWPLPPWTNFVGSSGIASHVSFVQQQGDPIAATPALASSADVWRAFVLGLGQA